MYFLFDIGGTKMKFALSDDGKTISDVTEVDTPKEFDAGMYSINEVKVKLTTGKEINFVSGCIAGLLSKNRESLLTSPNLRGWENKTLRKSLMQIFSSPIYLENDAAVAGLGEAVQGPGKDYHIVCYFTVSTGYGGARIVDGKIDKYDLGFAPGQQIISYDGYGKKVVYLEDLVSGSGILASTGKNPSEIEDKDFWERVHKFLAAGLNNSIVHWSPEVVILGGGLINGGKIDISKVSYYLSEFNTVYPEPPKLFKSELGDKAGLIGALSLIESVSK